MDKQGSHTDQSSQNNRQNSTEGFSTHGEIHKQTPNPGAASVSLDSSLTSALSRAPSPFSRTPEPDVPAQPEPPVMPAPQSAAPTTENPQPTQDYSPAPSYPVTDHQRQEPVFTPTHGDHNQSHEPFGDHHTEPSFDEFYPQEHQQEPYYNPQDSDALQPQTEAASYPAQYDHYQDGMNDVFDEASEKPKTHRTSFILLAVLGLVAIIAGGVIYFYKSTTTPTASKEEVPVIKAEDQPTKITPEKPGGIEIPHQKKLIYDRITGENSESSEQLVSRQEPVAPVNQQPATGNPFDQQPSNAVQANAPTAEEAKAKAMLPPGLGEPAPLVNSNPVTTQEQVSQPVAAPSVSAPEVQTTTPIAISPPISEPATTPPAAVSGAGDYVIQIASFRSQEEAVKNYENLSRRYSGLLSSYGPLIQRADLGSRGIYYRLRVGPIDTKETASNLCSNLIAQGQKDCLVRRK